MWVGLGLQWGGERRFKRRFVGSGTWTRGAGEFRQGRIQRKNARNNIGNQLERRPHPNILALTDTDIAATLALDLCALLFFTILDAFSAERN